MRIRFLMMGLALIGSTSLASVSAQVSERGVEAIGDTEALALPYAVLGERTSRPGENKVAFLKRIAGDLLDFSKETGFEGCARLASHAVVDANGDGVMTYAATLTTSHSNVACVNQAIAPAGYELSNQTIHSHGYTPNFVVNAADVALTGGKMKLNRRMGGRDQNAFSPRDMNHPGYLAGRTHLLYEDGKGQVQDLGGYEAVEVAVR